ncbi:MAG: phage holin family protein [Prevotella sp.]|jgi:phage-related holin|nr:phage holin family protein [Prevotella sp.]
MKFLFGNICKTVAERLWQHFLSICSGLLIAFEASIPFFIPCMIAVLLDVVSAYALGRRVHKKYPDRADGKFKSAYKYRIIITMIMGLVLVILAHYVDTLVIKDSDWAVRYCMGIFIGYQLVSMLENWSSENDNKFAKVLQKVLVNKAERHFNIDLSEFWDVNKNDKKTNEDETC